MGMKEYVRPQDGYRIRVSEKAYRLFYRKQGFVPAVPEQGTDIESEPDRKAEVKKAGEEVEQAGEVPKKKKAKKAPAEEKAPSGEQ